MMKVLVLGANGMAGHTISLYFKSKNHEVIGFDRSALKITDGYVGDAKNTDLLKEIINQNNFDAIINCIGLLNEHADIYKADAVFLNSYLPHFLVETTKDKNTKVIQMSTDCVFSGKKGSYSEFDFKDGETFYDKSKALGELNDKKNITLRNSIIGPDLNAKGIGLMNWFLQQSKDIQGYNKVFWTGLTTLELAKIMEQAILQKAVGLVNMVNNTPISKYDLLQLINENINKNSIRISKKSDIVCDKSLVRTNFELEYIVPSYETMILQLGDWIRQNKNLYPHYNV